MPKLLNMTELAEALNRSRPTVYKMIKDGTFNVQPVENSKPRLWRETEVLAWLSGDK